MPGDGAAHLGETPDLAATLHAIAAAARSALGADRATCYVYDVGSQVVSAVHTTEHDPARRAFLEQAVGLGAAKLPIWRLQMAQSDLLLTIDDVTLDPSIKPALAARLGSGALLGVRLEYGSVRDAGTTVHLGTLFCSYRRPRRFSAADCQAARGFANLAALTLANAHLQAETSQSLEQNRALTAEHGALRRVAMQVAAEATPEAVFARVAEEAAQLLDIEAAIVVRFAAEGATVVGSHGPHFGVGQRLPTTGDGVLAAVAQTGATAGIADYSALAPGSALRAHALANGYRASVAAPVTAAGRRWGAVLATTAREGGLAPTAETRLERFAELVALAIANTEARARLAAQAATDPLTGLANHRAFFERLNADVGRARRHGHPLSLVAIDLDHFKRVNDTHGHQTGDRVLVEIAERLSALVRPEDTLARVGGEEFAWLMPETDARAARSAAERARQAVAARPFPGAGEMTMSAGIAGLVADASVNELFRAADAALYWAKGQGRNTCELYAPEHEAAMAARPAGAPAPLTPSVERLLALAREGLGLPLAAVGEFVKDKQVWRHLDGDGDAFGVRLGGEIQLHGTYSQRVAEGRLPNLVRDARGDARVRDLPFTAAACLGAYAGVPITLPDGGIYGTLCCLSTRAEPALGERDVRLLRIVASMLGEELDRGERLGRARHQERENVRRVLEGEGLSVLLQPIVDLASGRVVAAEALSRFAAEPLRPPEAWFAEAAGVGLGVQLELTAIRAALEHVNALPAGARLSLNVSPAALREPEVVETLVSAPGTWLALEITEQTPVDDYAALGATLDSLRSRGVHLMVNDAGGGSASLRHVLGLHPDAIKLELSLTRGIDTDPVRRALAASIVGFAREIGATTVAQGIETRAELETLKALGVTHGQGYYLAPPSSDPVPERLAVSDLVMEPVLLT